MVLNMTEQSASNFKKKQARIEDAINRRFKNDSHPTNTGTINSLSDFIDVVSVDIDCEEDNNMFAAFETPEQRINARASIDRFKIDNTP